jgi:hypothetical protein
MGERRCGGDQDRFRRYEWPFARRTNCWFSRATFELIRRVFAGIFFFVLVVFFPIATLGDASDLALGSKLFLYLSQHEGRVLLLLFH